jgi:hypothetical protein
MSRGIKSYAPRSISHGHNISRTSTTKGEKARSLSYSIPALPIRVLSPKSIVHSPWNMLTKPASTSIEIQHDQLVRSYSTVNYSKKIMSPKSTVHSPMALQVHFVWEKIFNISQTVATAVSLQRPAPCCITKSKMPTLVTEWACCSEIIRPTMPEPTRSKLSMVF